MNARMLSAAAFLLLAMAAVPAHADRAATQCSKSDCSCTLTGLDGKVQSGHEWVRLTKLGAEENYCKVGVIAVGPSTGGANSASLQLGGKGPTVAGAVTNDRPVKPTRSLALTGGSAAAITGSVGGNGKCYSNGKYCGIGVIEVGGGRIKDVTTAGSNCSCGYVD